MQSYEWDVAISYAGEDRSIALAIVSALKECGLKVYYDEHVRDRTVGCDLSEHLLHIYKSSAQLCILIMSKSYAAGRWPLFELTAAIQRHLEDTAAGYMIPVNIDDTRIDQLPRDIIWLNYAGPDEIATLVTRRLASLRSQPAPESDVEHSANLNNMPIEDDVAEVYASNFNAAIARGFRRVPYNKVLEVTDSDLVRRCQLLTPTADLWTCIRLAKDLSRNVIWRHQVDVGPIYRCWRSGDRIFLSALPWLSKPRQKTLEFLLRERGPVLIAKWVSDSDKWSPIGLDEFHARLEGLMADRSGCPLDREAAILILKDRGAEFSFPIGPGPGGVAEELCGWRHEQPVLSAFDWDRDPRLKYPSVGLWTAAHHSPTGVVVLVFTMVGRWPNAAMYEFRDTLNALLPTRFDCRIMAEGIMRVVVYIYRKERYAYSPGSDLASVTYRYVKAAIARASAANNDIAIAPVAGGKGLPALTVEERRAFTESLDALSDPPYPEIEDRRRPGGEEPTWLDPPGWLDDIISWRFNWGNIAASVSDLKEYISAQEGTTA